MDLALFFVSFLLSLVLPVSCHEATDTCPEPFECGNLTSLKFPFTNLSNSGCGFFELSDCDSKPKLRLPEGPFNVKSINNSIITLLDPGLGSHLWDPKCEFFDRNFSLPHSLSIAFTILKNITCLRCNKNAGISDQINQYFGGFPYYTYDECIDSTIYFKPPDDSINTERINPSNCTVFQYPTVSQYPRWENPTLFQLLNAGFDLQWDQADTGKGNKKLKLILGTVLPGCASIFIVLVVLLIWRRKKGVNGASYFLSRNSSGPSLKPDLESGSLYFGVSVFSYSELEEATDNFDASKELGDGGFGTVYYGKLRDGREVAVKRLYEHNFKRVEQFINEIEILTRLRHRNLVTLYGCTSRRSRELLLVYEYIPNGTIADHLHGDRAQDKYLSWSHRMNIAIETADALAYLHKSDIIHRDVKTNNILLDHNFCVKVADFGISRLFPTDVTHISTAPQGTPGYVDPDYHQCYQLTDKSDVYSFGVVLIELISSMPAVDISRHRHEINLANLAINRIQRCAFDELIDSSLGYKSDTDIMRMTTSVAELAFQCLQLEKEMRPSMEEVLETLKAIQNSQDILVDQANETNEKAIDSRSRMVPRSPESEDIVLLKNVKVHSSPNSVADVWISCSSTNSTNG